MKPTLQDIENAVESLGAVGLVKYFPSDDRTVQVIMHELQRMVPTVEALNWLVEQFIRKIGAWHSLKELRAVLCARYEPLDGIHAISELPGYTPGDAQAMREQALFDQQAVTDAKRMLEARKQLSEPEDPAFEAENQRVIEEMNEKVRKLADHRKIKPAKVEEPIYLRKL